MFLATTALTDFWDTDQEILFLGSWCQRYDSRADWEGLRYKTLPSPWNDRCKFHNTGAYLDECGERMLVRLTDYLNSVHKLEKSERYWRVLIGPWLRTALHVVFDRYTHLRDALNLNPDLDTI